MGLCARHGTVVLFASSFRTCPVVRASFRKLRAQHYRSPVSTHGTRGVTVANCKAFSNSKSD